MYIDIITAEMNNEVTSDDTQFCAGRSSQKELLDYVPNWKMSIDENEDENRSELNEPKRKV